MKAVVLGGAGDMGRTAVRTAAGFGLLEELVVADLDESGASALASEVRADGAPTPVRAASVDVTDAAGLRAFLAPFDVVLNTTGPFYRFGVPVLEAAIDARCHYLDICDDWEPTLDMLERDERARAAGVTAVVGIGAGPGASNMLAALVRRELDEVEDLHTVWPLDVGDDGITASVAPTDGPPSAAMVHWMHQISGTVRLLREGRFVDEAPLQPVALDFPGVGSGTAYTVGHPEPITLGRGGAVRGASYSLMLGTPGLIGFLRQLQAEIDSGELDVEGAATRVTDAITTGAVADLPTTTEAGGAPAGPGELPPFFAWGRGVYEGKPRTVGAMILGAPADMAAATSVPLALALRQLVQGNIGKPGVHAPEDVLDPNVFFEDLAPYCTPPLEGREQMVLVTRG